MSTGPNTRPSRAAVAEPASDALADGLAQHLQQWSIQHGAPTEAADAAATATRALMAAMAQGHVCLLLDSLHAPPGHDDPGAPPPELLDAWQRLLRASRVVGSAAAPGVLPLVLDDGGRLYLHRYFDLERRLAQRLVQARGQLPVDPAMAMQLRTLFAANQPGAAAPTVDWQQLGAALALRQRLVVISGGPGTGKTTTVVNLLACLIAQQPGVRIALAAPTGKAAARMTEAIRARAGHLPPEIQAALPQTSFTIHRLLGVRPDAGPGGFTHHAGHRLPFDALVVDEASMLDLALATRLLEAVPDEARIILLGDKDQLAAVESGAVFAELSADPTLSPACRAELEALCGLPPGVLQPPAPSQPSALHDSAVWFSRNFRFAADSGIGRLAGDINAQRAPAALAWLRTLQDGPDAGVQWLDDGGPQTLPASWQAMDAGYAPLRAAIAQAPQDVAGAHAAFNQFRVLCAVREGPRGQTAVNERLSHSARQALGEPPGSPGSPWYAGRPVMVLRNDPVLRLFNGDVGLALPDAQGQLMVWFADSTQPGGFRPLPPVRLPAHQTAYAMTVHKSQGSEFDAVLLLLPAQRSPVLTRELLYTGVTRAKQRVTLCASAEVLQGAIGQATRRHSGLLARLDELLGPPA